MGNGAPNFFILLVSPTSDFIALPFGGSDFIALPFGGSDFIPEADILCTKLPPLARALDSQLYIPQRDKPHSRLSKDLYARYMGLLKKRSPLKLDLNRGTITISLDVCDSLLEEVLREKRMASQDYKEGVQRVLKL